MDRSNPAHLAAHVLAAACAEDHSLLDVLLVELTQRVSAHDLVAPTVAGPWVDHGDDHCGRYLATVGGTGPLFVLEVELDSRTGLWTAYAADGSGENRKIGEFPGTPEGKVLARAAGDAWARPRGWTLA